MGIRTTQTGYSGEEKYNICFVCEAILILYSVCKNIYFPLLFSKKTS